MTVTMMRLDVKKASLILGILLIAACLRAPVTGIAPLLESIRGTFHLSTTAAGALTTLPLLAFALASPFSVVLARRHGLERTLFGMLATIALGLALRSAGPSWCLYLGTWIIGCGIAGGNVLLPSLVKRDFPNAIASVTGAYILAMGVAAALGSAAIVPLGAAWGWRPALAAFLVLPLAGLIVWTAQLGAHTRPATDTAAPPPSGKIWHTALAWHVTLFLGLNSTIYYIAVGWLPSILAERGVSAAQAGSMHGVLQLATAVPGLVLGSTLRRMRDQRFPAAAVAVISAIALLGWLTLPGLAWIWSILFGFGTGAGIVLGLTFIALRTANAHQAAALSGMAQFVGYLLAAIGPMAMGALHDTVGGWSLPLGLCVVLALIAAIMGLLAGRDLQIGGAN